MPIIYTNSAGYEDEMTRELLVCSKLNTGVYPPKIERHKLKEGYDIAKNELGITNNTPMPKTCWQFKERQYDEAI